MGPAGEPYCDRFFLPQVMPQSVLDLTTTDQQDTACLSATQFADSYLRGRFQLPLLDWGADVERFTAYVACYFLCQAIGYAPQSNSDTQIDNNYYSAVGWPDKPGTGWFPGIQRQAIHPDVTPSIPSTQSPTYDLPQVRTEPVRGWQQVVNGRSVIS